MSFYEGKGTPYVGRTDLSALCMDFVDGLDSVQVIDTRVQTDFVEDNNSSLLGSGIQFAHGWGDVGRGDDVGLT